ncbi:MAG TPA: hypothetical protein VIM14_14965 [Polyangia bacterium]|jgi:hypothetical protein
MRKFVPSIALALLASASTAHAQGGYPDAYALRPLQLPAGMVQLKVPVIINLSKGNVGSPVFIPFELRLGLTSELELRIFQPGHGLCVSGQARGCGRVYNDLGLGLLYSVMREQGMDLALLGAVEVTSFASPAMVRLDAGLAFKYVQAPLSIAAWPYVGIGLNHRDGNGDSINIPVEFAYQLSSPAAIFVEGGLFGGARDFGNTWSSPLGVGINYLLQHGIDMGAEFKFTNLVGNGSGPDGRLFLVYFAFRN